MRLALAALLVPLVVLTVAAGVALHPEHRQRHPPASLGPPLELQNATVTSVSDGPCVGDASSVCTTALARLTNGPENGQLTTLIIERGPGQPNLRLSDEVVLTRSPSGDGTTTYAFDDFQRKPSLLLLGLIFAVLVVAIGRWRGVGALAGLVVTAVVLTQYALPAILGGRSPTLVALTAGAMIVLVVLYIAHGFNVRTTTAVIGTLLSLVVTGVMAAAAVKITNVTGLSSDDVTYVQNFVGSIDVKGLLLGGIIIGSLGVLNDMTVTQSSAVWEIHQAAPDQSRRSLYRAGMRVGRDHIASTVYTLVFAYAGAALPLLILFSVSGRHVTDVLGSDVVAEEIVRTVAGSIGLMLSVPLTTVIAAAVVKAEPVHDTSVFYDDKPEYLPEAAFTSAPVPTSTIPPSIADVEAKTPTRPPPPIAPPQAPGAKQSAFRRARSFDRKMSRRERKFWEDDDS